MDVSPYVMITPSVRETTMKICRTHSNSSIPLAGFSLACSYCSSTYYLFRAPLSKFTHLPLFSPHLELRQLPPYSHLILISKQGTHAS